MGERTGQFCELDHFQDFEIAPYGRFVLGQGNDTVSLIECEGVAVQLICDRHAARLDVGATLPANGDQRYLRNPYSKTIRGKSLQGHQPNFVRPSNEDDPCFKVFHQTLVSVDQYKRGTSLLVHTSWTNQVLRATANITDLGDWKPEWLGKSDA